MKTIFKMVLVPIMLVILFKFGYVLSGSNKLDNYLPFFLTSDGWNKYEREINSPEKLAERANSTFSIIETYKGKDSDGTQVILEFGTGANPENNIYKLTTSKGTVEGELNYERGWKDDENAIVYVLDWKKPEDVQRIFARKSNTNSLIELDQKREEIIPNKILNLSRD